MKKGLFTLVALVITISAVLGLGLTSNAGIEDYFSHVVVYDGDTWEEKANIADAVADGKAVFVDGKINVEDIDVVAIVDDDEPEYDVYTDSIVAIAIKKDVNVVVSNTNADIELITTKEVEFNGDEFVANVYVNTANVKAVVDKTFYADVNDAIADVEVNNFDNIADEPVVVIGKGDVDVTVDEMVVLGVYDKNNTTLVFNTDDVITYSEEVTYEGDAYTAYAVVNTNNFPAIVVDANTSDFEFVTDLDAAIADLASSTIGGATEKAIVVLKSGEVDVLPAAKKMLAVAVYDDERTTLNFGGAYTYETTVDVSTDFLDDEVTVYAIVNAAAVVIDVDVNNKDYSYKLYATVDAAIAAADGNLTKAVVVLKNGTVAPVVDDFVFLATVDNRATFNKAGYFTFDASVEYKGLDITGIAVYNTDYIFGGTADSINEAFPAVNATYTGTEFNIALSTNNVLYLASVEAYADILVHFAPLFVLGDEAYINGYCVYEGREVSVTDIAKAIRSCIPTLGDIENLESKTVFTVDVKIGSAGTYVQFPVNVKLAISDANFNKIKDTAALINKYFDLDTVNGEVIFKIDARPVVDLVFEKELAKGKTVKEVRDLINSMSINKLADKLEDYGFTGKKAEAVELFVKAVNKVGESKFASYLDVAIGMLDLDGTGAYKVEMSYTVNFGTKIQTAVNKFNAKFPEIANHVNLGKFGEVTSITVAVDGTIVLFDVYTVTFVDAEGNVIYTESLLEGEVPVYVGANPEKETDGEYIYTFAGWTDGVAKYTAELAPLTANTTYAPYYDTIALNQIAEDLKFEFGSVTFADSFKLNMYLNKKTVENYTNFWVVAIMVDGEERFLEYVDNGNYYQFIIDDIAAKEVADVIEFTVYAEINYDVDTVISVTGKTIEYGVKTYAMSRIVKSTDAKFKTLCVDALVYAAEAQIKFGYNTEALATADLTPAQIALGTQVAPTLTNRFNLDVTGDEAITISQAALVYESNVAIKVYFKLNDYAAEDVYVNIETYTGDVVRVDGEDLVKNGVYYTVEFNGYAAKELREDIVVTVHDANTNEVISGTLTYGAEAYAYRQVQANKDVALVNAMMNYAISAKAYF